MERFANLYASLLEHGTDGRSRFSAASNAGAIQVRDSGEQFVESVGWQRKHGALLA